jgi:hypothetical protein
MIDIFEVMDCDGCPSRIRIPGRAWGDPNRCYPGEIVCGEDALDHGPCGRMVSAIENLLYDGELYTESGRFWSRECLRDMRQSGEWEEWDMPEHLREYDFSRAPFWHIRDGDGIPTLYNGIAEVFHACFR